MQQLQPNTTLQNGKYRIIRFLSSGGFGNTYEGVHTMMDTRVAIKEFFPKMFCDRNESTSHVTVTTQGNRELVSKLRDKFNKEAQAVFKMKHDNIVRVLDIFEENGTAYYVMEYIDGKSLNDITKERGALPEAEAVGYIRQVTDALKYVHTLNRLHLDIKPGNIMIDKNGKAILIDFGASKHYDMESGENTSTLMGLNTKGYAPIEQSTQSFTSFSPATDIYALGATLYKLLTSVTPPDANLLIAREETLAPLPSSISMSTRNAVLKAMALIRADRPQTIEEFLSLLGSKIVDNSDDEETIFQGCLYEKDFRNFEITVKDVSFKMIAVRGGTFLMGATLEQFFEDEENEDMDDSLPVHEVTLDDYYIGETVVTEKLWDSIMDEDEPDDSDESNSDNDGDMTPAYSFTWSECKDFIRKLNQLTKMKFRLPTEAEWEFAARGGHSTKKCIYSGSNDIDEVAWYVDNSEVEVQKIRVSEFWQFWKKDCEYYTEIEPREHCVASKHPNELGIYDMSGNVWELCSDKYGKYTQKQAINPHGSKNGSEYVIRGGSYIDEDYECRISYRECSELSETECRAIGLRLALNKDS